MPLLVLLLLSLPLLAQPTLTSYPGRTPTLDGTLSPGEWDDATSITGVTSWTPQFHPVTDPQDLALTGYVKHDRERLHFAFRITDDLLYGIDTPRWLPDQNPRVHELSPQGWPWFGDEMEILLNARNTWTANENAKGDGSSWQMVCNLTKSRLGGVGVGGLMEGEPRSNATAFATYRRWIDSKAQECAARPLPGGKGYVIEWSVRFNPCVEVEPGRFYSPEMGDRAVGLNIALGDIDTPERGTGMFGRFHHEQWWSGPKNERTQLRHWGTLWLRSTRSPTPPR